MPHAVLLVMHQSPFLPDLGLIKEAWLDEVESMESSNASFNTPEHLLFSSFHSSACSMTDPGLSFPPLFLLKDLLHQFLTWHSPSEVLHRSVNT